MNGYVWVPLLERWRRNKSKGKETTVSNKKALQELLQDVITLRGQFTPLGSGNQWAQILSLLERTIGMIPATVDDTKESRADWASVYRDYCSYTDSRLDDSLRVYNHASTDLSSALEIEACSAVANAITDKRLRSHEEVLAFKQGYRARAARESEDALKRSREHEQELLKQSYNSKQEGLMVDDLIMYGNAFYTESEDGLKTRLDPSKVFTSGIGWSFMKDANEVALAKRFGVES